MLASPPSPLSFDMLDYLRKIEQKISEIEEEDRVMGSDIEQRDEHLIRLTQSLQKDLDTIRKRYEEYKQQLELVKKDLLALLTVYKTGARRDQLEKLQRRVEALHFEKNITRPELKRLMSIHTLKH